MSERFASGDYDRFRKWPDLDHDFAELIKQLGEETHSSESEGDIEPTLHVISRHGVSGAVDLLLQRPQTNNPANSSEVIQYLSNLTTHPPLRINDIGSVDEELIGELNLSQDNFIEEIRDIVTYIDPQHIEVSVLDLPEIQRKMIEFQRSFLEKTIIEKIIDEHGISMVFDVDDAKAWKGLKKLVQELSSSDLSDFSRHLRTARSEGKRTPIFDVISVTDEISALRNRAWDLACSIANDPPNEQKRALDGLSEPMRDRVQGFIEDINAIEDEVNGS